MDLEDASKTMFVTNTCSYYFKFTSFELKNMRATYQGLMDKAFVNKIGKNLELYIDDMVVKTN